MLTASLNQLIGDTVLAKVKNNQPHLAYTYYSLAVYFESLGQKDEVIHYAKLALPLLAKFGATHHQLPLLWMLAHSFEARGDLAQALAYLEEYITVAYETEQLPQLADGLAELAQVYAKLGLAQARQLYLQLAFSYYRQVQMPLKLYQTACEFGKYYLHQHQPAKAIAYLSLAITELTQAALLPELKVCQNLASAYLLEGEVTQATECLKRVVAVFDKAGAPELRFEAMCLLSDHLMATNQPFEAVSLLYVALGLNSVVKRPIATAAILLKIGRCWRVSGKPRLAIPYLKNGLRLACETHNQVIEAAILTEMGQISCALKHWRKAAKYDEAGQ